MFCGYLLPWWSRTSGSVVGRSPVSPAHTRQCHRFTVVPAELKPDGPGETSRQLGVVGRLAGNRLPYAAIFEFVRPAIGIPPVDGCRTRELVPRWSNLTHSFEERRAQRVERIN
jgi:hypothetical protein